MPSGVKKFHFDRSKSIGHVNVDDVDSIRRAFATFDKDGSGFIDAGELCACLKSMGYHPGPLELEQLLAQMDTNGDGVIDFDEFAAVMTVKEGEDELEEELEQLKNLYVTIDENGDGLLSCEELHKAFKIMNIDLDTDEMAYIFSQIDIDGSGDVTFEEFASYVWHFDEEKGGKKEKKESTVVPSEVKKTEMEDEKKEAVRKQQLGN
ncbi:hypothetical protein Ndes2526B_g03805 [Nannochloris sp. 'desiccata']